MASSSAVMAVDLPDSFVQAVTVPIDGKLLSLYDRAFVEKGITIDKANKADLNRIFGSMAECSVAFGKVEEIHKYYDEGNFVVQHEQAANHPLLKIAQHALLKGTGEILADFSRTHRDQETSKGRLAEAITPAEFVRAANSFMESAIVPQVPVAYSGVLYLAKISHNAEEMVSLKSKGSSEITFKHFGVHLNPLTVHVHFNLTGLGEYPVV